MSSSDKKENAIKPPDWLAKKYTKEELQREKENFKLSEFDNDFFMMSQESFFGLMFARVTKEADWSCPTAYIAARKDENQTHIKMGYNPLFFRSMTSVERRGVIFHELYHMILNHIFDRTIGDLKFAKLANIAYDMAVNSLIPAHKLPKIVIRPGTRPIDPETGKPVENVYADFIANAPIEQSYEWYFRELKKIVEQEKEKNGGGNGEGDITVAMGFDAMDDHGGWGHLDADLTEEVRHKMRELLEEAVLEADRSNNWGDIPMAMQGEIRKLLSREIDWKSVVKNFIGRVRSTDRSSTIKRINKKMPYIHPGVKRKMIAKFACFIDQSGSMSDRDIAMLFTELEGLAKCVDIDVFFFDTAIDFKSHFLWKKGKSFPTLARTRCGGTDFDCVADFLNGRSSKDREHFQADWSGAFILTDGYAAKMKGTRSTKVMWVLTEGGTKEAIRQGDLVVQMKSPDKGKFGTK